MNCEFKQVECDRLYVWLTLNGDVGSGSVIINQMYALCWSIEGLTHGPLGTTGNLPESLWTPEARNGGPLRGITPTTPIGSPELRSTDYQNVFMQYCSCLNKPYL